MTPSETAVVVWAVVASVVDVFLAKNRKPGDTWTEIIRDWSSRLLAVPFVLGVLLGHFFWPWSVARLPGVPGIAVVLGVAVSLVALSLRQGTVYPRREQFVAACSGIILGGVFWGAG